MNKPKNLEVATIQRGCDVNRSMLYTKLPLKIPYTLNICSTNICNFKCNYCIHSLDKKEIIKKNKDFCIKNMDLDIFDKIIQDAKSFVNIVGKKFKVVNFTGTGEPLINKYLTYMIKKVKNSNIAERVQFITNGSLFNHELSKDIIEAGVDDIRISLQGITEDKYKSICKYNINFKKFVQELDFLYKNRNQCRIYIKIMDIALEDDKEEEQFYDIFGNKCDKIFIEKAVPIFNGVDYDELLNEEKKNIIDFQDKVMNVYGEIKDKSLVCPQPFFSLTIHPNGEVFPCCMTSNPVKYGNILDKSLFDIWNSQIRNNFLLMQLKETRFHNDTCANCYYGSLCQKEDNLDSYTEDLIKKFEK